MINSLQQTELDLIEQKILTEIFGGYNPENFIVRFGIFKVDLSDKVQKYINRFEELVMPAMDERGYINGSELKKYVDGKLAQIIPEGNFRLIDIYDQIAPTVKYILGV